VSKISIYFFLFLCASAWVACTSTALQVEEAKDYDFNSPVQVWRLPSVLHEVSGVCLIDSNTLAMVQDERGSVFFYDMSKKQLIRELRFADDGDYEGICKSKSDLVVLRSDGELFFIHDFLKEKPSVKQFSTNIPANNNEGLCFDPSNKQLWIGCKSKLDKDRRGVFAWDIETQKLLPNPVLDIQMADVKAFVLEHDIPFPRKAKRKGSEQEPWVRLAISSVSFHPITGDLYLLSALDHALFIFSPEGKVKTIYLLDEQLFPKPEGISFFKNGDVVITNEGKDHHPTLLWFNYNLK
jgi:uncharacterized protein YjiK